MKTLLLALFLCLLPLVLMAQRVEVGLDAGPALSYRLLQSSFKEYEEVLNASERPLLGYRVGLDVVLRPQAKWQVGVGLLYNLRGFSNQVTFTDANNNPSESRFAKQLHYLDVPVFVRYRFGGQEQQSFYALAGVNNSFFLSDQFVAKEGPPDAQGGPREAFRPYNAGAMIGFGLRRQLSEKVSVEAGPLASLQLQNAYKGDTPARRYLYTLGLNLRAAYRL
ncbi:MAG: PorT family protein [Cytophagales bacterium]|nr:PorT family protein [Cytophagales bacterium]